MPKVLRKYTPETPLNTVDLGELVGDLQALRFAGDATVTNVSNASNVAHNKQVPIQIAGTTYYLTLETAAR